jgi:D-alanyl-D-alanine carboxypeptidase/D-alanyl-D-alanine-endopeptidase (penicillin-binding protein 4)
MSQNLQAQLLLIQVGRRFHGGGLESFLSDDAKGLLACPEFFQRAGIKEGSAHFEEGAGLSRANAVSPAATVALLRFMRGHRESVSWMEALPIAGVDGTLKNRFRKSPATGKVRAKTGTLRGVIALGGYVTTAFGEELTFAIYANQASVDPKSRARMDRWVETLAAYNGPLGH